MSSTGTNIASILALIPDKRARDSTVKQLKGRLKLTEKKSGGRIAGIRKQYGDRTAALIENLLKAQGISLERDTWILPLMVWLGRTANLNIELPLSTWPSLEAVARWSSATGQTLVTEDLQHVAPTASRWSETIDREIPTALAIQGQDFADPEIRQRYEGAIAWMEARITRGDTAPWPSPVIVQRMLNTNKENMPGMSQESFNDISPASVFEDTKQGGRGTRPHEEWLKRLTKFKQDGWRPSSDGIVHRWDNGMTLEALIRPESLKNETDVMGHCIGQSSYLAGHLANIQRGKMGYYSLRHPSGYSLCTFEIELDSEGGWKSHRQSKGPKNFAVHPTWVNYAVQTLQRCLRPDLPEGYDAIAITKSIHEDDPLFTTMVLTSPQLSLEWAKLHGADDVTRQSASREPKSALDYAMRVDKSPHTVTRHGASTDPQTALKYAKDVDNGPHEQTRQGASVAGGTALTYAVQIDREPTAQTLAGVINDPYYLKRYIENFPDIDLGDQRAEAIAKGPKSAFMWARSVEGKPSDETRDKASEDPVWALRYALSVDKCWHPVTAHGVLPDPNMAVLYAMELHDEDFDEEWFDRLFGSARMTAPTLTLWILTLERPRKVYQLNDILGISELPLPDKDIYTGYQGYEIFHSATRIEDTVESRNSSIMNRTFSAVHHCWKSPAACALYVLAANAPVDAPWMGQTITTLSKKIASRNERGFGENVRLILSRRHRLGGENIPSNVSVPLALAFPLIAPDIIRALGNSARESVTSANRRELIAQGPKSAIAVARYIDDEPKRDTFEAVASDSSAMTSYLRAFSINPLTIPVFIRRKIAGMGHGISSMERLLARQSYPVDSSLSQYSGDNYYTSTPRIVARTTAERCLEVSRQALTFVPGNKTNTRLLDGVQRLLQVKGRYGNNEEDFCGLHGQEDLELVRELVRRGHRHLAWMDHEGSSDTYRWSHPHGERPRSLPSSMALLPSSFPIYGYIGMMGVPNGDNVIASTAHRIGELEGPIPSAFDWSRVLGWYRSLPGMIRHHVDRRLDKNQRTDPSMTDIALLWIGSTPVDAIIGYPGCTFQIGLWINSTPALSIIPADIGRRASRTAPTA